MAKHRVVLVLDDVNTSGFSADGAYERSAFDGGFNPNSTSSHPGLRRLLVDFVAKRRSKARGLIVLTSQLAIPEIANWKNSRVALIDLDPLSRDWSKAPEESPVEPPDRPLPGPSPATHFSYLNGQFDVIPTTAWQGREAQAALFHTRARELAIAVASRLTHTDAVPDVAGSIGALVQILGEKIDDVQPDQLRLASRSIAARARAYGHQSAEWEISVESVTALFELADVLIDLQAFVRSDLEAHESAIRQLDLTPQSAAEAKEALDLVTQGILSSAELITKRVETAFELASSVSHTASDQQVKVAVEGDRILLTSNLALAVARELGRADAGKLPDIVGEHSGPQPEEVERQKSGQRRSTKSDKRQELSHPAHEKGVRHLTSNEFLERVLARIGKKGPDAVGDAVIQAAVSTIKHAPATVAALGAILVLWPVLGPYILGSGAIASTIAWLGFQLRRRYGPNDKLH